MNLNGLPVKTGGKIILAFLLMFGGAVFCGAQSGDERISGAALSSYPVVGNRVAVQSDGKILLAGSFDVGGAVRKTDLVRLNADGSLDASFNPNGSGVTPPSASNPGTINAIKIQADGKILIGGSFNGYNGAARINAARLNADGTLDTSFQDVGFQFGEVYNIEVQPNGRILVGGLLNVIRVDADGSLDSTFAYNSVSEAAIRWTLLPDGKIVIAGGGGNGIRYLRRLSSDGLLEINYPFLNPVFALRGQPDGKLLISAFTNSGNGIFRLNADGSNDSTFTPNVGSGTVSKIELIGDNKILINRFSNPSIVRLLPNGAADPTFNSAANLAAVNDFAVQPDEKIIVTGTPPTAPAVQRSIVRLNPNGSLDNSFNAVRTSMFDFDGDGKADISVFRPSSGAWFLNQSANGFAGAQFGFGTDKIVPADYDGDGKTDVAVYRNGTWYLNRSSLGFTGLQFGAAEDRPVPADYDGDGRADIAVWRPSNGTWYVQRSQLGFIGFQFGANGDKPVAADYDGDGRADYAVFRPSNGFWFIERSRDHFYSYQFGAGTDKPVPADYDGDGETDIAVYRSGIWYIERSRDHFVFYQFGASDDVPTPADYDGDGKTDLAVFRPANGVWYLNKSQSGLTGIQFGAAEDRPVPNAFVP